MQNDWQCPPPIRCSTLGSLGGGNVSQKWYNLKCRSHITIPLRLAHTYTHAHTHLRHTPSCTVRTFAVLTAADKRQTEKSEWWWQLYWIKTQKYVNGFGLTFRKTSLNGTQFLAKYHRCTLRTKPNSAMPEDKTNQIMHNNRQTTCDTNLMVIYFSRTVKIAYHLMWKLTRTIQACCNMKQESSSQSYCQPEREQTDIKEKNFKEKQATQ